MQTTVAQGHENVVNSVCNVLAFSFTESTCEPMTISRI
jgi:hypothetical protein